MLNQNVFLSKFGITEKNFKKTKLKWSDLEEIYSDYVKIRSTLEPHASFIVACLQSVQSVHSIKYRLKEPEHLIEKIIRRKLENPKFKVTLLNYRTVVSDLIGIRALHLFKEDWEPIHDSITKTWQLYNKPVANIREGDSQSIVKKFKTKGCQIKKHPFGYRSIHYILQFSQSKEKLLAEVQVRTIFEEGWSEIDHRVRYPYDRYDPILAQFVVIFNRLAGSADEMGSFIKFLKEQLSSREADHKKSLSQKTKLIKELKDRLIRLKIEKRERNAIISDINSLNKLSMKISPGENIYKINPHFEKLTWSNDPDEYKIDFAFPPTNSSTLTKKR